jgi:hypothetical protein
MKTICLLLSLAGAAFLCGCDKQAKINTAKIETLSQQVVQLQQSQAKQMAALQTQLTSLAPMLDKMNDFYFEKSHDEAFFFHTNTLFLLLTVGKKTESELQSAATEREKDRTLVYAYYTNEMDTLHFYGEQTREAMANQEDKIEDEVNNETRRVGAVVSDELVKQIQLLAPDPDEIARRKEMESDIAQIKRDMDQIKLQLGQIASPPKAGP